MTVNGKSKISLPLSSIKVTKEGSQRIYNLKSVIETDGYKNATSANEIVMKILMNIDTFYRHNYFV